MTDRTAGVDPAWPTLLPLHTWQDTCNHAPHVDAGCRQDPARVCPEDQSLVGATLYTLRAA